MTYSFIRNTKKNRENKHWTTICENSSGIGKRCSHEHGMPESGPVFLRVEKLHRSLPIAKSTTAVLHMYHICTTYVPNYTQ